MKSKVSPLPLATDKVNQLLARFEETREFSDFLEAFRIVLAEKLPVAPLANVIAACMENAHEPPTDWEALQDLMAQIDFSGYHSKQTADAASDDQARHPQPEAVKSEVEQEAHRMADLLIQAERKMKGDPYYPFMAASEIGEDLHQAFGEHDPGRLIARYFRAIFADAELSHTQKPEFTYQATAEIAVLLTVIIGWGQIGKMAQSEEKPDERAAEDEISVLVHALPILLGTETNEAGFSFERLLALVIRNAHQLEQRLFESVLWHAIVRYGELEPATAAPILVLSQLPFGEGYPNWEAFEEGIIREIYDELKLPWERIEQPSHLPFVPWWLWSRMHNWFYDAMEEDTFAPWEGPCFEQLAKKYHTYRVRACAGRSPLSLEATDCHLHFFTPTTIHDLALHLSPCGSPVSDGSPHGLYWMEDDPTPGNYRERAAWYFHATRLAKEEGLEEFSSALLAFFLFSQALHAKGMFHMPWEQLTPLIEHALRSPGKEMVRTALLACLQPAESHDCQLETLALRGWLGHRTAQLTSIPGSLQPVHPGRSMVLQELKGDIGEELDNLSEKSLDFLVDAEMTWKSMSHHLGRGKKDWGTAGVEYTKVFEAELVTRLGNIYRSDAYAQVLRARNKTPDKPTLGPLYYMLKDFKQLPEGIQADIRATGVQLQNEPTFLQELHSNIIQLRNKGAHTEPPFSEQDFAKLRTFLFDRGALKRFAHLVGRRAASS